MDSMTSGWRVLRRIADAIEVPWANGAGTTRELVGWDNSAALTPGAARWRLSIARLERAGEFSALPGIDRTFLLTGADATLSVDGIRHRLRDGDLLRFSGDQDVVLDRLSAPCHAVNLMVERSDAGAAPHLHETLEPGATSAVALGSAAALARFDLLERTGDDVPWPVAVASLTLG